MKRLLLLSALTFLLSINVFAQQCENLQAWYNEYNEQYFGNTLPKDTVVKYKKLKDLMATTSSHDGVHFEVDEDPAYNLAARTAHATLLHEMCHIETWSEPEEHGHRWISCMHRLMKIGAFDNVLIDGYSSELKVDVKIR